MLGFAGLFILDCSLPSLDSQSSELCSFKWNLRNIVRKWNSVENNADTILGIDTECAHKSTQTSFTALYLTLLTLTQESQYIYHGRKMAWVFGGL